MQKCQKYYKTPKVHLIFFNLFTTIHDGNFRRHSSMNVTIKWHKFSTNIYYIYVFFVIWSWKLRQQFQLQMTKNRTPTPVYLDPGMHPGLEVKGLNHDKQLNGRNGLYYFKECHSFYNITSIWIKMIPHDLHHTWAYINMTHFLTFRKCANR